MTSQREKAIEIELKRMKYRNRLRYRIATGTMLQDRPRLQDILKRAEEHDRIRFPRLQTILTWTANRNERKIPR